MTESGHLRLGPSIGLLGFEELMFELVGETIMCLGLFGRVGQMSIPLAASLSGKVSELLHRMKTRDESVADSNVVATIVGDGAHGRFGDHVLTIVLGGLEGTGSDVALTTSLHVPCQQGTQTQSLMMTG